MPTWLEGGAREVLAERARDRRRPLSPSTLPALHEGFAEIADMRHRPAKEVRPSARKTRKTFERRALAGLERLRSAHRPPPRTMPLRGDGGTSGRRAITSAQRARSPLPPRRFWSHAPWQRDFTDRPIVGVGVVVWRDDQVL
jgi:hypothetical protein